MQNPPPVQTPKSSTGLDENIAALLSYVFGWVSGLIFFLIEKDSRLVKFHAMQSILLNALVIILMIVVWIVTVILWFMAAAIGNGLGGIVTLLSFLIWLAFGAGALIAVVICLIKAFQGTYFKLPIIGNFAEKFSSK